MTGPSASTRRAAAPNSDALESPEPVQVLQMSETRSFARFLMVFEKGPAGACQRHRLDQSFGSCLLQFSVHEGMARLHQVIKAVIH